MNFGSQEPTNTALKDFVEKYRQLCQPDRVFWCDGSEAERDHLTQLALQTGVLLELDQQKLPGCYYHRSNPNDVARVEQCTFICTPTPEEAGPTNNWRDPAETYDLLHRHLAGAMKGRTMYVIPYLMGPASSPLSKVGIEITDSIYVVLNMRIMARMGHIALQHLGDADHFNRGVHSTLDLNPERRFICHFPQDNTIISVGSGYGGNVLLGKKCLALRIGSWLGRQQGWLAEHMLLLAVEDPQGRKSYIAAAFPSACGKTNFAMLIPPAGFEGWKITTIGDDIAWMKPGPDGRLYAINPEAGYFGVAPGTNSRSNKNAMLTIGRDTIFTNVALRPDNTVWWEGHDDPAPENCLDWKGQPWTPQTGTPAAHPNSRFTAPMRNNPALAPEVEAPQGVPITAIIFGGRRRDTVPLVYQAHDWTHGVYIGATMGSETTAAAAGATGQVRRDPMAMLPFCGYHIGDYFAHWLHIGQQLTQPPAIFSVNWFRKDKDGNYLWPGYGENMRILQWILNRAQGHAHGTETPLGTIPSHDDLNWTGLDFSPAQWEALMQIDPEEWAREIQSSREFFAKVGDRLPKALEDQAQDLLHKLQGK